MATVRRPRPTVQVRAGVRIIMGTMMSEAKAKANVDLPKGSHAATGKCTRGKVRVFYYPNIRRWKWYLPDGVCNKRDVVAYLSRGEVDVQNRSDV